MSRTLRLEWIDPADLVENPLNWRRHPTTQRRSVETLLAEVGWAGALLYNERTGRLIDGHLRRDVALQRGEPVPVLVGSWTEEEERLILAALDPTTAMAEADAAAFQSLIASIDASNDDVAALLDAIGDVQVDDIFPYGDTATDREGQGVSSTWGAVKESSFVRVVIGTLEFRISGEVVSRLQEHLHRHYAGSGRPYSETMEAVLIAGLEGTA